MKQGKAFAVLCALVLAACTRQLDMGKVKGLVTDMITKQVGAKVKGVTCPDSRETKEGDTFECSAEIDHGSVPVTISQTDGSGKISANLKVSILKVAELEKAIKQHFGAGSVVDCGPKFRPSTPSDTFECTVNGGGTATKVKVTVKDDKGNIHFASEGSGNDAEGEGGEDAHNPE